MARLSRRKLADYASTRLLAGDAQDSVLAELAAYLVDTRRTKEAELIVRDIESALALRGFVLAHVTSARSLEAEAKQAVHDYIATKADAQTVTLTESIDKSLIGGVRIEFPGRQLDATVKAKLEKLIA